MTPFFGRRQKSANERQRSVLKRISFEFEGLFVQIANHKEELWNCANIWKVKKTKRGITKWLKKSWFWNSYQPQKSSQLTKNPQNYNWQFYYSASDLIHPFVFVVLWNIRVFVFIFIGNIAGKKIKQKNEFSLKEEEEGKKIKIIWLFQHFSSHLEFYSYLGWGKMETWGRRTWREGKRRMMLGQTKWEPNNAMRMGTFKSHFKPSLANASHKWNPDEDRVWLKCWERPLRAFQRMKSPTYFWLGIKTNINKNIDIGWHQRRRSHEGETEDRREKEMTSGTIPKWFLCNFDYGLSSANHLSVLGL